MKPKPISQLIVNSVFIVAVIAQLAIGLIIAANWN